MEWHRKQTNTQSDPTPGMQKVWGGELNSQEVTIKSDEVMSWYYKNKRG